MDRVFVIGLDGGEPSLIFRMVEEGKLPVIAELVDNGAYGKLRSTIPPITGPAWVSMMTGKNPGKHGIFHFVARDPKTYQRFLKTSKDIDSKVLWQLLSENDKRVGIVNVPFTYPPQKVNGFLVSGLPAPGEWSDFTYPEQLKHTLKKFDYKINTDVNTFYKKDAFVKNLHDVTHNHFRFITHALIRYNLDFFMYVFQGLDQIQHFFWGDSCVEEFYMEIDKYIGVLKEKFDDATFVIVSDHGFGKQIGEFYIGNFLIRKGLLKLKKEKFNIFRKIGLTKDTVRKIISRSSILQRTALNMPRPLKDKIPSKDINFKDIDWFNTQAYSCACGEVYINLKGRERYGTVDERDYGCIIDYISDEIVSINKNFRTYKNSDIYSGKHASEGPDLIVNSEEAGYLESNFSSDGSLFGKGNKRGTHRFNGVVIISGDNIKSNKRINASIYDITPTILDIFDMGIPKDCDGRSLLSVI